MTKWLRNPDPRVDELEQLTRAEFRRLREEIRFLRQDTRVLRLRLTRSGAYDY